MAPKYIKKEYPDSKAHPDLIRVFIAYIKVIFLLTKLPALQSACG
jgi:hypothetical protein